jgi:NADPH:quinone reductase-like Zn-dependent oxidoreductase
MGSPHDFRGMLDLVNTHEIHPAIDRVYPMNEVVDAAERLARSDQFGKVVLTIP